MLEVKAVISINYSIQISLIAQPQSNSGPKLHKFPNDVTHRSFPTCFSINENGLKLRYITLCRVQFSNQSKCGLIFKGHQDRRGSVPVQILYQSQAPVCAVEKVVTLKAKLTGSSGYNECLQCPYKDRQHQSSLELKLTSEKLLLSAQWCTI